MRKRRAKITMVNDRIPTPRFVLDNADSLVRFDMRLEADDLLEFLSANFPEYTISTFIALYLEKWKDVITKENARRIKKVFYNINVGEEE